LRAGREPRAQEALAAAFLASVVSFVVFWALVWLGVWVLAPDLLVAGHGGLQTMLQVVPATVVAIFVLVLGSALVVAQQSIAAYGNRAAMVIVDDATFRSLVVRPLLLSVVTLLLAGSVPAHGAPPHSVSAA